MQDGTELHYTSQPGIAGLGSLSDLRQHGWYVHPTLAVTQGKWNGRLPPVARRCRVPAPERCRQVPHGPNWRLEYLASVLDQDGEMAPGVEPVKV
ncbi:MAG TPA: hypothetical protein P5032_09485, partial [Candidatus Competibacter sp.]|nr:hypothetical protein [Candidatus Competibacter sp.]